MSSSKVLKVFSEKSDLLYGIAKVPLSDSRDFLLKRTVIENYKGFDFIIFKKSIEDVDFPPNPKYIRGHTHFSSLLMRKTEKDNQV